ncbi:hypothetical protein U1Q18_002868 [Sarracenia purpurea var. burkii]
MLWDGLNGCSGDNQGKGFRIIKEGMNLELEESQPGYELGLKLKGSMANILNPSGPITEQVEEMITQVTQPTILSKRDMVVPLTTRAPNWKRRARGTNGIPNQSSSDGAEKKRKLENEGGLEDEEGLDQAAKWKKSRIDMDLEGT